MPPKVIAPNKTNTTKGTTISAGKSMQLLPNQFSVGGGVGGGPLNATAINGRYSSVPGLATSKSKSTSNGRSSVNVNINVNGGSGNVSSGGGGGKGVVKEPLSDEKQLKLAYSLYLQQGLAKVVAEKWNRLGSQIHRDKVGSPGVVKEVDSFLKMKRELFYRESWLGMLEACMESAKLRDMFTELRAQFQDGRGRALEGLKTALASQFDYIYIAGEELPKSKSHSTVKASNLTAGDEDNFKLKADEELEQVIERVKAYLADLEVDGGSRSEDTGSSGCGGGGTGGGRRLSEDNPQFLVAFTTAMSDLIREHGAVSGSSKDTTDKVDELVISTSGLISALTLEKRKRKRRRNNKVAAQVAEAFEETHNLGHELDVDETGNNLCDFPLSRSPSPVRLVD